MNASRITVLLLSLALLTGAAACSRTVQGVRNDVVSGARTVDVKAALIADRTVDTDSINVDTYADKKLIVLRGSVPTEAMKVEAERIAKQEAPGYTIENRLAVVPEPR